ncbi:MAG: ABC transporter ATP-binding protein [bacterium]
MIEFDRVGARYASDGPAVLSDVTMTVPEGELCLVVGPTGAGKSTLLATVNGRMPHFTGGELTGRVRVDGRDTRTHPPRELADAVGVVGQNPWAGFVTDTVSDELAYTMESLGVPPAVMRRRVEDIIDALGLAELRERPLRTLSSGQAQRVAIGAVLTAAPRVLVLDEPTSALDPGAAEEVLALLQRLVHDLGLTLLLAEHRLERVIHYADSVVRVEPGRAIRRETPAVAMLDSDIAPAVVQLGRVAGWEPLPLSVRDARRRAPELRRRLPLDRPAHASRLDAATAAATGRSPRRTVAWLEDVTVRYDATVALAGVRLDFAAGDITTVMGRNGAGKSTLLNALTGLARPTRGRVRLAAPVDGNDAADGGVTPFASGPGATAEPHRLNARELIRRVGLVPQQPADLFFADSVAAECAEADGSAGVERGTAAQVLTEITGTVDPATHPRDLSEGQQLSLALALVLVGRAGLVLLDEPTRGLDYPAKVRLGRVLRRLAARGCGVVVATHDVELAAAISRRTIVMADAEVVADGPTSAVVTSSPAFAPQVAKVLAPLPYLTVDDVRLGLVAAS